MRDSKCSSCGSGGDKRSRLCDQSQSLTSVKPLGVKACGGGRWGRAQSRRWTEIVRGRSGGSTTQGRIRPARRSARRKDGRTAPPRKDGTLSPCVGASSHWRGRAKDGGRGKKDPSGAPWPIASPKEGRLWPVWAAWSQARNKRGRRRRRSAYRGERSKALGEAKKRKGEPRKIRRLGRGKSPSSGVIRNQKSSPRIREKARGCPRRPLPSHPGT